MQSEQVRVQVHVEAADGPVIAAVSGMNKQARTRRFVTLAEIGLQVMEAEKTTCWQPNCAQLGLVSNIGWHDIYMTILIRAPLIQVLSKPSSLTNSERLVTLARIGLWQEQQWLNQLQSLQSVGVTERQVEQNEGKQKPSNSDPASDAMRLMLQPKKR
ncbi:hypothetical protein HAP94_10800 [Acidithiobacillus ferrivorans]|nr:hypothetical protein [Acidithiobacillus ferrivorans]